ncbi:hypothetical protein LEN26_009136 [Aphanomyces euteiches]|nr:hypothetical protein LEN26_009136 [Aphanomyces euteiches]
MILPAVVLSLCVALAVATAHTHKITALPGYNDSKPINFDQFAGYIRLPSNGQSMFYWLVEAETTPRSAPLVLWLNGGPGCSSLSGFFTELGPFVVQGDLTVKRNPYAWNRKANMIFLDSPAGVGFSRPVLDDSEYNDDVTAARTYEFLVAFFAMYPQYNGRAFYVAGESYAGIYIPFLVHNLVLNPISNVNFTGFAIGNPFTDRKIDGNAAIEFKYTHGLISIETYQLVVAKCPPHILWQCEFNGPQCTAACFGALMEASLSAHLFDLNPYYIYGDVCLLQDGQARALKPSPIRPNTHRGEIGPCHDQFATAYLQLPQVQRAIHAYVGEWTPCAAIAYTRSASSLQKYPTILAAGLKVLIYSGDADSIVNFVGTQRWITREGLNLSIEAPWRPWFGPDQQLAGYTETYTNLTFTTIKGAGHMVPATRPLHALYMFECLLYGQMACETFAYPTDSLEYLSGADLTSQPGQNDSKFNGWLSAATLIALACLGYFIGMAIRPAKTLQSSQWTQETTPIYRG